MITDTKEYEKYKDRALLEGCYWADCLDKGSKEKHRCIVLDSPMAYKPVIYMYATNNFFEGKACSFLTYDHVEAFKEPKYRPYKNASEVPMDCLMLRCKSWEVGERARASFYKEGVQIGCEGRTYKEALEQIEHIDGKPFGVLEDE